MNPTTKKLMWTHVLLKGKQLLLPQGHLRSQQHDATGGAITAYPSGAPAFTSTTRRHWWSSNCLPFRSTCVQINKTTPLVESSNCLPFRSTCVHINNTAPLVERSKYLPFRSTCVHINNTTPLVESSNCLPFRSTCVHINFLVVGFMLLNLRFMCSDRVDHCLFFP
jgi:hypothetical protein